MLKQHGQKTVDGRWHSSAAERNCEAIWTQILPLLPSDGPVVEIASGSGQHIVKFAEFCPELEWQPTEPDEDLRLSIEKQIQISGMKNIRSAIYYDVTDAAASLPACDLIININMLHVAPVAALRGLFSSAKRALRNNGKLFIYGPFKHGGTFNSPGNEKFDETLKKNQVEWGLREINEVIDVAAEFNFDLQDKIDMPANNTSLIFCLNEQD